MAELAYMTTDIEDRTRGFSQNALQKDDENYLFKEKT